VIADGGNLIHGLECPKQTSVPQEAAIFLSDLQVPMPRSPHDQEAFQAVFLSADFPYGDLHEIARTLELADIFVPGYIAPNVGLYHPDGFLYENHFQRIKTILLPDRNIVSRMAQVAKGEPIDEQRRLAAAVLAFAQCLDILIEPSIAFHELAPKHGNDTAHDELAWFRVADNGNAHHWVAAALGRRQRIEPPNAATPVAQLDLAKPLRRWRRNYVAALKIGALELAGGTPLSRLLGLFEWMLRDFIIAGPAAMFACVYFAPNSPPRRGLLKHLRSRDRARAIAGTQNAAWDITHLSDLIDKVSKAPDGHPRYIFASLDDGLRGIAKLLFSGGVDSTAQVELTRVLSQWWPPADAGAIADTLFALYARADDPDRQVHRNDTLDFVDAMIAAGEAEIAGWAP